jgi:hypothetical protein
MCTIAPSTGLLLATQVSITAVLEINEIAINFFFLVPKMEIFSQPRPVVISHLPDLEEDTRDVTYPIFRQ